MQIMPTSVGAAVILKVAGDIIWPITIDYSYSIELRWLAVMYSAYYILSTAQSVHTQCEH